jgi:hypothetical protein
MRPIISHSIVREDREGAIRAGILGLHTEGYRRPALSNHLSSTHDWIIVRYEILNAAHHGGYATAKGVQAAAIFALLNGTRDITRS